MQQLFPTTFGQRRRVTSPFRALRQFIVAVASLALGGCADVAGPRYAVAVDVRVPSVVQAELSLLTDFTVDADIVNGGGATVLYERWCNWRVEQLVNGKWTPAYNPVCATEAREIFQLWIGESVIHRYPAHRSWRVGNGSQVPGTYRLLLTVFSGAPGTSLTELNATIVVSNSFTVQ